MPDKRDNRACEAFTFDCDGVLLDTNNMKSNAFIASLRDYPKETVARFSAYQKKSFGRSRYRLFEDYFERFLERAPKEGEVAALLEKFSGICRQGYMNASLTEGAAAFLEWARNQPLFVVSGSDQEELRSAFNSRGIGFYFQDILGSPTPKTDNLRALVERRADLNFIAFFGDAAADFRAARSAGVPFHYISRYAAAPEDMASLQQEYGFPASDTLCDALQLYKSRNASV